MQENKNLVEEALIQMKNVEEAIAENAKGILASTMKEEINQLVKESLSEQEEVDVEVDDDEDSDEMNLPMSTDNMDELPQDDEIEMGDESEDTPIDLTGASDEELLRVFKAMGEEDGIIVKKDDDEITLKDNSSDSEYLIKLGESKTQEKIMKEEMDEASIDDIMAALFEPSGDEVAVSDEEESNEDVMYEIEFNEEDSNDGADEAGEEMDESEEMDEAEEDEAEEMDEAEEDEAEEMDEAEEDEAEEMDEAEEDEAEEMDEAEEDEAEEMDEMWGGNKGDFKRRDGHKIGDVKGHYKDFEMDEAEEDEAEEMDEQNWEESMDESYNPKKATKPKGVGIGKGPKFSYKTSGKGGFKEDKKEGPKTMGTGKPKFEFKKGANMEGKSKIVKKAETKEAARTYGMGSKKGRGLRKGISNNRNLVFGKGGVKTESLESEVSMLREKNEEYRKALNVFREKLNEVAIFNSNLAYATRLFTEHSTTKKEKINILRRFDTVESLKESKTLYKSIKEELNKGEAKPITEAVETKLNKTVTSGSAINLIESKTYENPQFLRMKDLMSKIG